MDKQTLSNYGWIVIAVLVLSVMLALATPFGSYVGDAVVGVANGFVNTNNKQISDDNLEYTGYQWDNKLDVLNPKGVIPADAVYYSEVGATKLGDYSTASATYKEGDRFPEVKDGDVYVFGDYEYRYNMQAQSTNWNFNKTLNGWGVRCLDNSKQYYGSLLESINFYNITTLDYCFNGCNFLTTSPKLPKYIVSLSHTYQYCTNLTDSGLPNIPMFVRNMSSTFSNCLSLCDVSALIIPQNVTALNYTFTNCKNLQMPPTIEPSLNSRWISNIFNNCTSLKTLPEIHSNTIVVSNAFKNNTSLTGTIKINCYSISSFVSVFSGVDFQKQKITLVGNYTNIDTLGATGINYCDDCNGYCTCGNY